MTTPPLEDKLDIEGFRDDEWFNDNIWGDDLDKNEIVELTLKEIKEDVRTSLQKLQELIIADSEIHNKSKIMFKIIEVFGKSLTQDEVKS